MAADNFCQLGQVALPKIFLSEQKLSPFLILMAFRTAEHARNMHQHLQQRNLH